MTTLLVTGGAGFIGSNFVRGYLRDHPNDRVINVDLLTYAGNLENLADLEGDERHGFVRLDIADAEALRGLDESIDAVVHFAAESHVDRSIEDASAFLRTNVVGTQVLLDFARERGVGRFVHVSTDEVYGSLGPDGAFSETSPIAPNSPYAASKASSDFLVRAAHHTHGLETCITRCSNNYGPWQFPEKLIPLMVSNAMADEELPVYGDGLNVRDWIYVEDHCRAITLVLEKGESGAIYNIGARCEKTNLDIVHTVLDHLGKPESLIRFVKDRLGHDRRYAIDSTHVETELGFRPQVDFDTGIRRTVDWYVENRTWWERIKSGAYMDYYERMYGNR